MDKDYYEKGSVKIAEVTAVQLKKLEQRRKLTKKSDRMVICLVGLPGRGKSFIARKLQTFLKWRGNECEVFNVGKYRRQVQADHVARTEAQKKEKPDIRSTLRQSVGACDANFFDSKNPKAAELRQEAASAAMVEMLKWLDVEKSVEDHSYDHIWASATKASIQRSRIAIFDATNSTAVRRQWVLEECTSPEKRNGKLTGCMFVESVCDDQELLEENFRFKVQNSPDFKGMTEDEAIADLRHRVQKYEEQYETIDDDSQSYIKIFNLSSKLLVNHIYGRMAKVIVPSLMSWNIGSRAIYLCRSGHTGKPSYDGTSPKSESQKNARGDLLGPQGLEFRDNLEKFIKKEGHAFAKRKSDAMMMPFAPLHKETGTSVSGLAGKDDHPFAAPSCAKERPFSCHIMTSTMPRAVQTATWEQLPFPIEEMPNLNPLDKGDFTGMELEEIKELHPAWYAMLEEDPFLTRLVNFAVLWIEFSFVSFFFSSLAIFF